MTGDSSKFISSGRKGGGKSWKSNIFREQKLHRLASERLKNIPTLNFLHVDLRE